MARYDALFCSLSREITLVVGFGVNDRVLSEDEILGILTAAFDRYPLAGERVLVIIPDGTRSGPVGPLFKYFHKLLSGRIKALDYLIALGTHMPMTPEMIQKRLEISAEEMNGKYKDVRIYNHEWQKPETFIQAGVIPASEIERISQGRLSQEVPVTLNKMLFAYDRIVVCGPVFPHEVAGFSGGTKYYFPGVSGPEVINLTHWLGALITCFEIIGTKHTPVREVIDLAASYITTKQLFCCYVAKGKQAAGLFVSEDYSAWSAAADLSSQIHIRYLDRPYKTVLAIMPQMYDDIWTAGKGMYKLEPIVATGGELIIYAPHIDEISYTHGKILDEVGYHVRDYFVSRWDKYKNYSWGVLAHASHVKGMGSYEHGIEKPRVQVTLATGVSHERCKKVNLGYRAPASIVLDNYRNREAEDILVVDHAGEVLHRLKNR